MQLLNNFKLLSPRAKILLIVGGFIFLSLIIFALAPKNNQNSDVVTNEYTDPRTGETVSDPEGKTPENASSDGVQTTILGLGDLLDHGLTLRQIGATKKAFDIYSTKHNLTLKEASIDPSSIQSVPRDPRSNQRHTLKFNVQFDRKDTYDAKLEYFSLTKVQLYILSGNKIIFDSGVVEEKK